MAVLNQSITTPNKMFGVLIPKQPVITNFTQISETQLQLYMENFNELTNLTIFNISAPQLVDGQAYSIYLQQGKLDPIFLGQLTSKLHSISQTVTHFIKNREDNCVGYIVIQIDSELPLQPDQFDDREKLNQIGQVMADDLYNFISSYDDVYFMGDHYVPYAAVQQWLAQVDTRIKSSPKFWGKIQ